MKLISHPTLADSICDTRRRKIKKVFFKQINTLLDWKSISKTIDKYYTKGESVTGKPSYDGLLLFKMCLLQTWYGLSDYEVEDAVNDRISFSYFCGLTIDQVAPDHSTVSRFRTALTKANAYDPLFKLINSQLKTHQIIVVKGVIVDTADLPQEIVLKADKGYQSAKNNELLKTRKLKNHILKKTHHLKNQKSDLINWLAKHVLK